MAKFHAIVLSDNEQNICTQKDKNWEQDGFVIFLGKVSFVTTSYFVPHEILGLKEEEAYPKTAIKRRIGQSLEELAFLANSSASIHLIPFFR